MTKSYRYFWLKWNQPVGFWKSAGDWSSPWDAWMSTHNILLRNFFSQNGSLYSSSAIAACSTTENINHFAYQISIKYATKNFTKTSRLISSQPGVHKKPLWHFVLHYSKIPLYSCSDLKRRKKSMRKRLSSIQCSFMLRLPHSKHIF